MSKMAGRIIPRSDLAQGPTPVFVLGAYALVVGLDDESKRRILDELATREVVHALEC